MHVGLIFLGDLLFSEKKQRSETGGDGKEGGKMGRLQGGKSVVDVIYEKKKKTKWMKDTKRSPSNSI